MSATMMNHSRRQMLTPSGPSSINKKKEINGVDDSKPSAITTKNLAKPSIHRAPVPAPAKLPQPTSNNHLFAGYLAQEFLTKGTLFGEPWDPARAEAVPLSAAYDRGEKRKAETCGRADKDFEKQQRYLEVADLVKGDGTHLPGIVNPTQLARFLQLS